VISRLHGSLLEKSAGEAVVDVAGVGYKVFIPVSTFYRLGDAGATVTLLTHTHVREDTLSLYGFCTSLERRLFERLIEVAGVGPKLALSILSGAEPPDLIEALRHGDVARLTRIPGVGRKTAERLILELREKLKAFPADAPPSDAPPTGTDPAEDLHSALANLGYSRQEAEKAIGRARQEGGDPAFEDLLRRALRVLSGR
jgi:Holliday junction DNA helicase RuvA